MKYRANSGQFSGIRAPETIRGELCKPTRSFRLNYTLGSLRTSAAMADIPIRNIL
jgi:hypothetical protein